MNRSGVIIEDSAAPLDLTVEHHSGTAWFHGVTQKGPLTPTPVQSLDAAVAWFGGRLPSNPFLYDALEWPGGGVQIATAEQADAAAGTGAPGSDRTYVVKPGDTLSAIALNLLGDPSRSREIADLNGIPDENLIIVGQVLIIPTG